VARSKDLVNGDTAVVLRAGDVGPLERQARLARAAAILQNSGQKEESDARPKVRVGPTSHNIKGV
jgi:hypothetical protein